MSGARRLSFETGHRPKFLVVVDETPECDRAVRFAARRCARTGASLVMLGLAEPPENFEWLGVADALQAEAEEAAAVRVEARAAEARQAAGIVPEQVIRTGEKTSAILTLIEQDQDISFLVLAAGADTDGPGPLVSTAMGLASGRLPVPIVIVPGHLDDDEIDALAG